MVHPKIEEEGEEKNLVYGIKLSSVVPGKITGENKTYELKGIDLAMKLHYLKGLYFFTNNTNSNIGIEEVKTRLVSILEIKKPMFDCLVSYFMACGRIRVVSDAEEQRPMIKFNDAGVRIVEAESSKTIEEWLAMKGFLSLEDQLVYDSALGPDLPFSPLVCLQVTWFKCGGISMGLSWAHILGDAFSATEFMNMLGQYMKHHHQTPKVLARQDPPQPKYPPSNPTQKPVSIKRVDPVSNHWVFHANCKIVTHTFVLTSKQLDQLHLRVHGANNISTSQCFEVITSIMWKSIAKVRKDMGTNIVTICKPKSTQREHVIPYNGQVIGTTEANFLVSSSDPLKLINLIVNNIADESDMVEELVSNEIGKFDFIVYGANLTFVDMEEANLYGFELKGRCPRFASYAIDGRGDEGVVLVLSGPIDENNGGKSGKLIVVHLLENEIEPLKCELKEEWSIE